MSVKSIILSSASVAALVFASNASAADVPHRHISSAIIAKKGPQVFSWEGLYAGAQLGYESAVLKYTGKKGDKDDINSAIEDTFGKPSGVNGGLYAGYNIDLGSNIVAGLDGDINISAVKKEITNDDNTTNIAKSRFNGAVRARLGYSLGRVLPYVAGGLSFADCQSARGLKDGELAKGKKPSYKVASGWNLGAGVDYAFSDNLVVRADYRYQDLKNPAESSLNNSKVVTKDSKDINLRSNNFRVGVAYKF